MTRLLTTRAELAAARADAHGPVVLVPTMGALHDGHRALLRRAWAAGGNASPAGGRPPAPPRGTVIVSVFVNPLQFGEAADLERYPRTLDADMSVIEAEGGDFVFAPPLTEMYPREQRITVDPGPLGTVLEGEFRPGHFAGMLTVVLKLFSLVRPDVAVFGEKDAQQLALVRLMVDDFGLPIAIEGVPTVRDADGLAISSRNRFLSISERRAALSLPRALSAGAEAAGDGPAAVLAAARKVLADGGVSPEYIELVDGDEFTVVMEKYRGTALLLIAARVGQTRLIDNIRVEIDAASN
ncbi:MAG: pantoate--beta-alanine ligase [Streptosporangiaceae bacterium]|jgi:pantoate--beta-alanine ligase